MALGAALALGGCEGVGSLTRKPDSPPADPNMFPRDYRVQVLEFVRSEVKILTGIRDAAIAEPVLKPIGEANRYVACVRYNAKDDTAQYLGLKEHAAIFLGGRLNQFLPAMREQC